MLPEVRDLLELLLTVPKNLIGISESTMMFIKIWTCWPNAAQLKVWTYKKITRILT